MGLEQTVSVPAGASVPWPALRARLAEHGFATDLKMIDGLLAFPDEEPPADWRELRAGTPAGMVTMRRTPKGVAVVVWGTADPALHAAANAFLWALADLGPGHVETPGGPVTAGEFARTALFPWAR